MKRICFKVLQVSASFFLKKSRQSILFAGLCLMSGFSSLAGQEQTIGLFLNDATSFNGYTLFTPMQYTSTYLIDNNGLLVHAWENTSARGGSVYLLENGHLLRATGGRVEEFDWDDNLVWTFVYSNSEHNLHHDIAPLPNGNVLMIAWKSKSVAEAIAAGRDPALLSEGELQPEHIIEVEKTGATGGNIVWEWHVWDHLIQDFDATQANFGVIADHPELIDINYLRRTQGGGVNSGADWLHANAVDYNAEYDQIMLSIPNWGELWIIDHSTTIEEAAEHTGGNSGKGGDILYRWENPETYQTGTVTDKKLFFQHNAQWIGPDLPGAGNILVFNNGQNRPEGNFSTIDELLAATESSGNYTLSPGSAYGPAELTWRYTAPIPTNFYSSFISGTQRLPNGNTLICSGAAGTFFEIDSLGTVNWLYISPVTANGPLTQGEPIPIDNNNGRNTNLVFRTTRYAPEYPGLAGRVLTPGEPIEINPATGIDDWVNITPIDFALHQNYPNPFNPSTTLRFSLPRSANVTLTVYNVLGQKVAVLVENEILTAGEHVMNFEAGHLSTGVYIYRLEANNFTSYQKMMLIR